jgi:hypothetical protein
LSAAALTAADLAIPAGAELVKAVMCGMLFAILAETAEPIDLLLCGRVAAPSELRH